MTEEQQRLLKRKNKNILAKVKQWQEFPYIRPLVCQNESCLECKLKPKLTKYKVILQCPKCKKVQPYVPKIVLKTHLSIPDTLLKNKANHRDRFLDELLDDSEDPT